MGILTLTMVIRYHVGLLMPKNLWTSGFWGTFSANASKTQILLIHVGYHSVSIVLNSLAKAESTNFLDLMGGNIICRAIPCSTRHQHC